MKNYVIILICVLVSSIALGQNQKVEEMKNVLEKSEVEVTPPKFTGIEKVVSVQEKENIKPIADYLSKNVQYPEEAAKRWHEGTEVVEFVVSTTGEVTDFKVINSVSSEIDEELIRVLKTTNGMWNPGYNNGEPVAMQKEVSMIFKIDETKSFATQSKVFFKNGSKYFLVSGKLKRALKSYDKGIKLLPNDKSLLLMRGFCRYELGYIEGARQDWQRIKDSGGVDMIEVLADYDMKNVKGYEEFMATIIQAEQ